jgi:hypothetical protein
MKRVSQPESELEYCLPDIPYQLVNFPKHAPSGTISASRTDLVKAAIVVGVAPSFASPRFDRPIVEMIWRAAMVWSNLSARSGYWVRSSSYDRLDPTEKVSVSYFLGMTQAQLTCRSIFGYSHLTHLDRLLELAGQPLRGRRPDFLAVDPMRTSFIATVEAKGRTRGFEQAALTSATLQATAIPTLPGFVPSECVASVAYFDANSDSWSAMIEDPPGSEEQLPLSMEDVLMEYYRPIIEAGRAAPDWEELPLSATFSIPSTPFRIALPRLLVSAFDSAQGLGMEKRRAQQPIAAAYRSLMESGDALQRPLDNDLITCAIDEQAEYAEIAALDEENVPLPGAQYGSAAE